MGNDPSRITQLLKQWGSDKESVREALIPMVYDDFRRIAGRQFAGESGGHTLQPTALVSEAFLQLEGSTEELTRDCVGTLKALDAAAMLDAMRASPDLANHLRFWLSQNISAQILLPTALGFSDTAQAAIDGALAR